MAHARPARAAIKDWLFRGTETRRAQISADASSRSRCACRRGSTSASADVAARAAALRRRRRPRTRCSAWTTAAPRWTRQMTSHRLGAIRMSVDYEPSRADDRPATGAARACDRRGERQGPARAPVDPAGAPRTSRATRTARRSSRPTPRSSRRRSRRSPTSSSGTSRTSGSSGSRPFNANGTIASGKTYEAALAASYDALKAVNPSIDVDRNRRLAEGRRPARLRDENTISPVRFIKAVGDAYRASKRTKPIMDNVALHPYPFVNTDPPDKGAPWPQRQRREPRSRGAGVLGRLQRHRAADVRGVRPPQVDGGGGAVRWVLDEAGWQTDTRGLAGYTGTENTPPIDEATQASYYKPVMQRYACDNACRRAPLLPLDRRGRSRPAAERPRAREPRDEAGGERGARPIQAGCSAGRCSGGHSIKVDGASSTWKPKNGNLFAVKAFEDATFVATATPTKPALQAREASAQEAEGAHRQGQDQGVQRDRREVQGRSSSRTRGRYTYSVKIASTINPKRGGRR